MRLLHLQNSKNLSEFLDLRLPRLGPKHTKNRRRLHTLKKFSFFLLARGAKRKNKSQKLEMLHRNSKKKLEKRVFLRRAKVAAEEDSEKGVKLSNYKRKLGRRGNNNRKSAIRWRNSFFVAFAPFSCRAWKCVNCGVWWEFPLKERHRARILLYKSDLRTLRKRIYRRATFESRILRGENRGKKCSGIRSFDAFK